jgi:hypothetical protein
MCEDFAPNFGDKRSGRSITTTHRLTLLFSPGIIWPKNNMTAVPLPPHVSLFPRLKIQLKGRHFDTTEAMEAESQAVLNTTSRMHLRTAEALGTVHTR